MRSRLKQAALLLVALVFLAGCQDDKAESEVKTATVPTNSNEVATVASLPQKKSDNAICGCGGSVLTLKELSPGSISSESDIAYHLKQKDLANAWLVSVPATKYDGGPGVIVSKYFSGLPPEPEKRRVIGGFNPFQKELAEQLRKKEGIRAPVVYSGAYANNPDVFKEKLPDDLYFAYEFTSDLGIQVILKRADEIIYHSLVGEDLDTASVQAVQVNTYNPETMDIVDTYQTDVNLVPDFSLYSLCGGGRLLYMTFASPDKGIYLDKIVVVFNSTGDIVYNRYFNYEWEVGTNPILGKQCNDFIYLKIENKFSYHPTGHLIWDGKSFIDVKE